MTADIGITTRVHLRARTRLALSLGVGMALVTARIATAAPESPYDISGKYSGSYLCIATAAGGAKYDNLLKEWRSVLFNVADSKFALNVKDNGLGQVDSEYFGGDAVIYTVTVSSFDSGKPISCLPRSGDFTNINNGIAMWKHGGFSCTSSFTEYTFNLTANRYLGGYLLGYVSGEDSNSNTPFVEIGKCTKLE